MMEPDRLGVTIPNHRNHRFILLPPPIPFPSLPPPSIFFSRPRDNHVASVDPGKRVGRRDCARSRFEAHLWTNLPVVLRPGRNTCSCKMHSQHAGRVDRLQWFKIMTITLDEKKTRSAKQDSNYVNFWTISQHTRAHAIANAKCPIANAKKERSVNASKQTTHPRSERTPLGSYGEDRGHRWRWERGCGSRRINGRGHYSTRSLSVTTRLTQYVKLPPAPTTLTNAPSAIE